MIKAIIFDCFGVLVRQDALLRKQTNDELLGWIRRKQTRFAFGLLSNTSREWLDTYLGTQEQSYFQVISLSAETGKHKPGPDAYRHISAQLNVPTKQCLFIDDSSINLQGAEAIGMQTLLYKNFAQFERDLKNLLQ